MDNENQIFRCKMLSPVWGDPNGGQDFHFNILVLQAGWRCLTMKMSLTFHNMDQEDQSADWTQFKKFGWSQQCK